MHLQTPALVLGLFSTAAQAWSRQAPRNPLPLIWFTKGNCLEQTSVFLIISCLLEAFLTPISWLDAAFKGFLGGVECESHPPIWFLFRL